MWFFAGVVVGWLSAYFAGGYIIKKYGIKEQADRLLREARKQ